MDFLHTLGAFALASGAGTAGVHLVGLLLKYTLAQLKAKAAKTATPLDDLALQGVEVAVDQGVSAAEKALGSHK